MKWYYILIFTFFYKLLFNINAYLKTKFYFKRYEHWVSKPNESLLTHEESIKKLFKLANLKDSRRPYVQQITNMHIYKDTVSVIDNMFARRADIQHGIIGMFQASIGVFRSRILETFSPFYWINLLLFLPRNILDYLKFDPEKASYRILNVIFTATWWIFITSFSIFKDQIKVMVINFIEVLP
ncbi:hypothetical protein SAMN02745784_01826 [Tissierella praeacuta DSM 18095]|uniref:Uncharacterized protein n=1 Tax=Tissierella praeacuta DSM 18095 TaxID=1123404 RepID=A0A1M4WEP9_9FIRM|nr:hypothetical protein SAMN02745784_01826 [Tissierella praeacuta DSM 18095]